MKRFAAIDLGTNSVRLMDALIVEGELKLCHKELIMTRLGQDVNKNGFLADKAMDRTIEALKLFKGKIENAQGTLVAAIATSAVRDSSNRHLFVERVFDETGIEVDVISGEEEAELAYRGVLLGASKGSGLDFGDNIGVIDIGGGSTEVIIGDGGGIKYSQSFNLGSVRLTEMFVKSDPPSQEQIEEMKMHIKAVAGDLEGICKEYKPKLYAGIAGTITTLAAIALKMEIYHRDKIEGYKMERDELGRITKLLSEATVEEKKKIHGLQPQRADIIASGSVLLDTLAEIMGINTLVVSDFDNLEGILIKKGIIAGLAED